MATQFLPGGGSNPAFGRDTGAPPPRTHQRQPYGLGQGNGIPFPMPGGFHNFPCFYVPPGFPFPFHPFCHPPPPNFVPVPTPVPPTTGTTLGATPFTQRPYTYTSDLHNSNRTPQPHPSINPLMPAANLTNSTGGVGCEPGYNYFFPSEHTKIHVLKSGTTPPWQQPPNVVIPFHACHVPTSTTVAELMAGFGATNPQKKLNTLCEVVQGGNGKWYRGLFIRGDEKEMMGKRIGTLGWDQSRTGLPGGKPVVYIYLTRD